MWEPIERVISRYFSRDQPEREVVLLENPDVVVAKILPDDVDRIRGNRIADGDLMVQFREASSQPLHHVVERDGAELVVIACKEMEPHTRFTSPLRAGCHG